MRGPDHYPDQAWAGREPSVRRWFDDGREVWLSGAALMECSPSGYDGEVIEQLINVPDPSHAVSKTQVHARGFLAARA